ncbi:MAG: hypothetical protein AAF492_22920, partial [Verrucomicrobiota bacterium]
MGLRIEHADTNRVDRLQVGFSRKKITPVLSNSVYLAGFDRNRVATAIHDDLWAMACVIDDGRTRIGIVTLDVIGFFHNDVVTVRKRLSPTFKLDYTVICSTHNHNGPDLLGLWGPSIWRTGVDSRYREQVIQGCITVLEEAAASLTPAAMKVFHIPTPSEGLVTDSRKPVVFDNDLRVMQFVSPSDGSTLGGITTWASHPETPWSNNTEITADFPGYYRDTLEQKVGGTHLYINGAIGGLLNSGPEVTVRDPYLKQDFREPSHEKARALGRNLADRVLRRLRDKARPEPNPLLSVKADTITISLANRGYLLAPMIGLVDRGQVGWKRLRTDVAL